MPQPRVAAHAADCDTSLSCARSSCAQLTRPDAVDRSVVADAKLAATIAVVERGEDLGARYDVYVVAKPEAGAQPSPGAFVKMNSTF